MNYAVKGNITLPTYSAVSTSEHSTLKTILHIKVASKNYSEIATEYGFNIVQNKQLDELLKPEYNEMWKALITSN